jgi:hypothetical protein
MALQGCSLMLTLGLRPHISRVVTLCEVVCICLEIATTAALMGVYMTPAGDEGRLEVSELAVGGYEPHVQHLAPRQLGWQCGISSCSETKCVPSPQSLDSICAALACASIAVQLAAVIWRLLGQLLAVEGLVFVLFKPQWMVSLHVRLAFAVVRISSALQRAGAIESCVDISEWMDHLVDCRIGPNECSCCLAERVAKWPCSPSLAAPLPRQPAAEAKALLLLELPADESPGLQRAISSMQRWSEGGKQGLPVLGLPSYRSSRSFAILEMPEQSFASTGQHWPSSVLPPASSTKMAIMLEDWEGDADQWAQKQESGRFEDMVVLEEPRQRRSHQQPATSTGSQDANRATPLDARPSWRRSSSFRPHISGELQQTSTARGRPQRTRCIKEEELLLLMAQAYMELAGLGERQLPPSGECMELWMQHLLDMVNSGDGDSVLVLFGHMQRDHPGIRLADVYSALVYLREKVGC